MDINQFKQNTRVYEYMSASNPTLEAIPVLTHPCHLHQQGETRIIPFNLKDNLKVNYPATSPNLLVSFIRIKQNDNINYKANATSHAFYIINGSGKLYFNLDSYDDLRIIEWSQGDMIVLPLTYGSVNFEATQDSAIYCINDEPLLNYLKVKPSERSFDPTFYSSQIMIQKVEEIKHADGSDEKNRIGILLGNKDTDYLEKGGTGTLTLTPILWSLLNILPANQFQKPHRHNSVALDLCVFAKEKGVYTLMGPELDDQGMVKDPIKCDWETGSVFVTPPGWWHSHHNETDQDAWVLPVQDAGLYTYQRTLNIEFS
jgi:gentisate 1,2-dioxygenase